MFDRVVGHVLSPHFLFGVLRGAGLNLLGLAAFEPHPFHELVVVGPRDVLVEQVGPPRRVLPKV